MVVSSVLISTLVALSWQICIWRFGLSIMIPTILISAGFWLLVIMISLSKFFNRPDIIGINDILIYRTLAHPLWISAFVLLYGLILYGLWRVGIRIFEQNDPD
jgi:hypothetical protein